MMWGFHDGSSWWPMMITGPAVSLLLIAVMTVAIVWAVRRNAPTQAASTRPLDVLRERYARGEIDEAEYTRRARVLA